MVITDMVMVVITLLPSQSLMKRKLLCITHRLLHHIGPLISKTTIPMGKDILGLWVSMYYQCVLLSLAPFRRVCFFRLRFFGLFSSYFATQVLLCVLSAILCMVCPWLFSGFLLFWAAPLVACTESSPLTCTSFPN